MPSQSVLGSGISSAISTTASSKPLSSTATMSLQFTCPRTPCITD
jgi:hypothetical protein